MKHLVIAIMLILLSSCYAMSQSDSEFVKTPEISISAGLSIPYLPYPFKNFWKTGFNMGFGYGYKVSSGSLGYGTVGGKVEYNQFPFDREGLMRELKITSNIPIEGKATVAFTVMATARGTFATGQNAFAPFFVLGLGYMNVSSGEITFNGVTVRPRETRGGLSYQLGGGLDVAASERVKIFVEAKFFMGFTSDPGRQYFPIVLGARITP